MGRELGSKCDAFFYVHGKVGCSSDEMRNLVATADSRYFSQCFGFLFDLRIIEAL